MSLCWSQDKLEHTEREREKERERERASKLEYKRLPELGEYALFRHHLRSNWKTDSNERLDRIAFICPSD
ncbi:unnamed protein product [Protopolystoma xenopodis]|uniref:Uncharacterized protein n=1 Tax=Protopolystoma xenopodis TaxID=117903 RepID=A0A3S5A9X3_9PLAT|nr:unnamed protein product [Protopolystoma xenopodis]